MNGDFHYYATYCTAILAGYSHEEACDICYSAQFVDLCSRTFLSSVNGPKAAATTQLSAELVEQKTDFLGLQEITRYGHRSISCRMICMPRKRDVPALTGINTA